MTRLNRRGNRQGLERGRQISRAARARRRRIVRLYVAGLSVGEITRQLGVSRTTASRHLRSAGIIPSAERLAPVWTGRRPYWELHRSGGAREVVLGRKFCAGCGHWRHVADFGRDTRRPGLLLARCEACVRRAARHYWANMPPEIRADRREAKRFLEEKRRRRNGARPRDFKHRRSVVDQREAIYLPVEPLREAIKPYANGELTALAERAGVPERTITRIRHEGTRVQIDVADKLAVALGVPSAVIWGERW